MAPFFQFWWDSWCHSRRMTTVNPLDLPSRRRRHACLIATLAAMVGDCASAATAVYGPIALAAPEQTDVAVNLWLVAGLRLSAGERLDRARAEDAARWPASAATEQTQAERTFAARCAAAEAERILTESAVDPSAGPGAIALPTAAQSAAIDLVGAGADLLALFVDDPVQAIEHLQALVASGEFTADQILDEACATAALTGLMVLQQAQRESDPSTAAEACLSASRYFSLAVAVASTDAVWTVTP